MNQTGVTSTGSRRQARRKLSFTLLSYYSVRMPYLRFSRNRRGYEHTYVLHTFRGEGQSKPRLLYWFRTPPGVRVGRHPLDEEAIRAIEENNPNLAFDWGRMLKVQPPPPPDGERRAKGQRAARPGRGAGAGRAARPSAGAAGAEPRPVREPRELQDEPPPAGAEPPPGFEADEPAPAWRHPVVALMGDEMLERLRARYAEIKVRIAEKRLDPDARDALRARAETLNPDGWATAEDAVRGIERFEAEAEAIRGTLGRRRPRTRRAAGSGDDLPS